MGTGEHLLLAHELVVVLLSLGIKARIVIGIPRLRAGRVTHDAFIQTPHPARAATQIPSVVGAVRLTVTPSNESGPVDVLRGKQGIEGKQPEPMGDFEI